MPKYTREELHNLNTTMDFQGKIALAGEIVLQCSPEELPSLLPAEPASSASSPVTFFENDFADLLRTASTIRLDLEALADPGNAEAWRPFVEEGFSADKYIFFAQLTSALMSDKHQILASNLALHTPKAQARNLHRNIHIAFGGKLEQALGEAAILNDMLTTLLGDNPARIFKSRDFNPDLFKRYRALVNVRLADQESLIAVSLLAKDDHESILKHLHCIATGSENNECPFHKIIVEMTSTIESNNKEPALDPSTPEEEDHSCYSPNNSLSSLPGELTDIPIESSAQEPSSFAENYKRFGLFVAMRRVVDKNYTEDPAPENPEKCIIS